MNHLRLLLIPLALSFAVLASCGDDDGGDDPRAAEVGAAAENIVYAWASAGPEAVYDYLTPATQESCPEDELADALSGEEQPTDFGGLDGVDFVGERAEADVVIIYGTEEKTQTWHFEKVGDSWRISDMPGLENCVEA
jgi:hypothetical protein